MADPAQAVLDRLGLATNASPADSVLQRLGIAEQAPTQMAEAAAPAASASLTPSTDLAVKDFDLFSEISSRAAIEEKAYLQENALPGVPLDTREGAGLMTRLKVGIHRNKLDQLDVLRRIYGPEAIRVDKKGNFIARVSDEKGTRDILVDERDLTFRDWADVASELPAFGLSMLTTKGVPVRNIFETAAKGAAGFFTGGAITDFFARLFSGEDTDVGEIAKTRGTGAVIDFGAGAGIGVAGRAGLGLMRMARGGASSLGEAGAGAMTEIEQARQRVKGSTGVALEPTLAELSGNPMLRRVETFLSNIPGARGVILRKWAKEIENEKAVMEAMGAAEVPDLGERLITQLQGEGKAATEAAGQAADVVRAETQEALTSPLAAISGRPISSHAFGQRMIRRGEAQLDSFKQKARDLYGKVRAVPAFTQPLFDQTPIQFKSLQLQDELLKEASGDVAKGLAPTGVVPLLEQVEKLPANASYFDLQKLRESIYDRIGAKTEPISDRGTKLLKELGAEVTHQMQTQGPKIAGKDWALVEEANKYYRDKVETFYQKGIVGMLKPRTESGSLDPERIASQLIAGGKGSVTTYKTLEDFFEKPQALADMNRLLRDRILEQGTDPATGLMRLENLSDAVNKMEPEIVERLFNVSKDKLLKATQEGRLALKVTGKSGTAPQRGTQEAVEVEAFKDLLNTGKITSASVGDLANATTRAKTAYNGVIRKAVEADDLGVIAAAPETFAKDYLFSPNTPLRDVKDAMQSVSRSLDPELISDVRRAYLHEVLSSSFKKGKEPVDVVARIRGSLQELDPQALSLKFQSGVDRERMEAILGRDAYEGLRDFALAIGGRTGRETGPGSLVGTGMINRLITTMKGLPDIATYFAVSHAITSPTTLRTLRQLEKLAPERMEEAVKMMVLSPEFTRTIISDSTSPEEAKEVTQSIQQWAQPR